MPLIMCQRCQSVVSLGDDDSLCPNCGSEVIDPEDKNLVVKRKALPKIYIIIPLISIIFIAFIILLSLLLKDNYEYIEAEVGKLFFATIEDFFNLFFFSIIFGMFSWALIRFRSQIKKTRKAIKAGITYINDLDGQNIEKNVQELHDKFTKNTFMESKWREFEKSIKKVENDKGVTYYNTIDVSYFFNEDTLFLNRFLASFIFSIPTMLTGIGIFGTFFGLVIGLQPFKYVTDFSNSKEISMLTSQLLSGISTAFLSSLWGILFSILLNFFLFYGKSVICNEIDTFAEKLKAVFPKDFSNKKKELREIQKTLESHTKIIENLSETLTARATKTF